MAEFIHDTVDGYYLAVCQGVVPAADTVTLTVILRTCLGARLHLFVFGRAFLDAGQGGLLLQLLLLQLLCVHIDVSMTSGGAWPNFAVVG